MRLHIELSEYENQGGSAVSYTTMFPDGATHMELTEQFNKILSLIYGYSIGEDDADPFDNS